MVHKLTRTRNIPRGSKLTKYMGAYMPLRIFNSISIFCLANGVHKTHLMEEIFSKWMKESFKPNDVENYYKVIATQMHNRYEELKLTRRSLTYSMFIENLKTELSQKSFNYGDIQNIIKEFDTIHFNK